METSRRRKVLVVGGAGYIGSVLNGMLLRSGYAVRCLDLFLYENENCVTPYLGDPGFEFVHGDFADRTVLNSALQGVTDVIILGGLVGDPITKKYPELSQAINHEGVLNLIAQLNGRGLNRVLLVSTCSNYGLIPEGALAAEDFELKPLSLYAKAKVEAEKALLALKGKTDFTGTVLRFATAFGLSPRMRFDLTVSEFTREMFLKRDLLVYDAHTWRPYCHVADLSRAMQKALEAPAERVAFEVFNVGGDAGNFTKQRIVDTIKKHLPDARVEYKEHGSDPRNYRVDFSKIKRTLDFQPAVSVEQGVTELLAALQQKVFARVDENKRFYGNYEIRYEPGAR